jgi:hypothetical protein
MKQKQQILRVIFGCVAVGALVLAGGPAQAQTTANGPYYAEPAWDQTLACTATTNCPRFIVLSNMNSEAVLDRETGLVWERSPDTSPSIWNFVQSSCIKRRIGSTTGERRQGWRLPSLAELSSLVDFNNPGGNPDLPPGHPFIGVQSAGYWSATTDAAEPAFAWAVAFENGGVSSNGKASHLHVWCVRGGMNADAY